MKAISNREPVKKVAVVIPCYNEALGIAQVIQKLPRDKMVRHSLEIMVIVVDNNSTDNTEEVARNAGAKVVHEPKKGKGNALRTGFASVPDDIDYVVMLDGDDTYNPKEILRMIEPLRSEFCDVVVGSRLGGHIKKSAMKAMNRFGNKCFTKGVRLLYRANVTDVLTGYFAWKKPVLDKLAPHIKSSGFAIEMEMITKMAKLGFHMASVPISYDPRTGESNLHPLKDGSRILMMLLANLIWHPKHTGPTSPPRKRIVFVSDTVYPYVYGGKEKRLHEITKHMAAMGHDVHIYTMHWWDDPVKNRIEHGVQLHALCRHHRLYTRGRRSMKEGVLFGLACFKLVRVRFDILDVDQMPFFPVLSCWIVCKLRGKKLYATWHEALTCQDWITYMGHAGRLAAAVERICTLLPYQITAASQQTKELLESIHGRMKKVNLVTPGIDSEVMNNISPAAVDCDVLYAGRLVKDKNIDKLILAIEIVAQTHSNVQCLIIGKGPEKKQLQREIDINDLTPNITIMDPLPEATDVYAYMKAATVFCSPSIREGFGIASLEALGCGTPVIVIDSPANATRHLVKQGENGSIVPLKPEAIAAAITFWMAADKKPEMAPYLAGYDWHELAQKQAEVYAS